MLRFILVPSSTNTGSVVKLIYLFVHWMLLTVFSLHMCLIVFCLKFIGDWRLPFMRTWPSEPCRRLFETQHLLEVL